ncbi:MAG: MBL fold metallo-hydrolase [Acidobacteria bacterium RIFCSPLOWO2_02_FULL_61_28]|nr:MAG: MBL fold metallo-hydrolase [Acidobacteria bacterium RIFCSPLOWO2_02_FULL_61_28]
MIHEILPVGLLQCNCSILGDEASRTAIVVDPGDEIEEIVARLDRHQFRVQYIVITHAHIDHIGGAKKLKDLTGAPVYMNERDMEIYGQISQQAAWIGMPTPERTAIDVYVRDGDVIRWGDKQATVLHTPGHTGGSICLHLPDGDDPSAALPSTSLDSARDRPLRAGGTGTTLIAGDTLFRDSIGRTDLPGGNFGEIMRSIHEKLLALDDATIVVPGHGPLTTIGRERERNPFLQ